VDVLIYPTEVETGDKRTEWKWAAVCPTIGSPLMVGATFEEAQGAFLNYVTNLTKMPYKDEEVCFKIYKAEFVTVKRIVRGRGFVS
jgi:hypothetical protein